MAELLSALASVTVAIGAIIALGGTGVYMIRRKANGQTALPGSAHDETVHELRAIHKTLRAGFEANGQQHDDMMNTLAPRRVKGGS